MAAAIRAQFPAVSDADSLQMATTAIHALCEHIPGLPAVIMGDAEIMPRHWPRVMDPITTRAVPGDFSATLRAFYSEALSTKPYRRWTPGQLGWRYPD